MIQEHNQQKAQATAVPERMSAEKKQASRAGGYTYHNDA